MEERKVRRRAREARKRKRKRKRKKDGLTLSALCMISHVLHHCYCAALLMPLSYRDPNISIL